jgi:hypothetical protein
MMESGRYHASVTTDDVWICYPWEAKYVILLKLNNSLRHLLADNIFLYRDIDEHDALAKENPLL